MLRKFLGDPNSIVQLEDMSVEENLAYKEVLFEILDRQVKRLRNIEVASIKVLWRNQQVKSATWETTVDMRKQYPHLFYSSQA